MLLYSGILFQNNCGSFRRLHHSALLLILLLFLPCPHISFTLNSKPFFFNNPFLLSLVCTNSCRVSGPLTLLTVFISQSFSLCCSFSHHSSTPVSVNKPPSVISCLAGTLNLPTDLLSLWSVGQLLLLLLNAEVA